MWYISDISSILITGSDHNALVELLILIKSAGEFKSLMIDQNNAGIV